MKDLEKLQFYTSVALAELDKNTLESNGIHSLLEKGDKVWIADDDIGVALYVKEKDLQKAKEILNITE